MGLIATFLCAVDVDLGLFMFGLRSETSVSQWRTQISWPSFFGYQLWIWSSKSNRIICDVYKSLSWNSDWAGK